MRRIKDLIISTSKWQHLLVLFLFIYQNSRAQENFKGLSISNNKPTHSFGISYKNNVFLPEKVWDEKGLIKRNPKCKYGFEIMLNYNLIIKKQWGVKVNLFLLGAIPNGYHFNEIILPKDSFPNSFDRYGEYNLKEIILGNVARQYYGGDILINYTFKINNRIFLQPEIGLKLTWIPYPNVKHYVYVYNHLVYREVIDNNNLYIVSPDLIANFNFLFHTPKAPRHNFLLGLSFNYGFVQRLKGSYEIINLGKYNTTGKVSFGSTHFGINLGYQFIGLRKSTEKSTDTILFNPRF